MSKGTDSSSVMPEVSRSSVPRTEAEVEPNYLAYHIHEVEELFAQEENLISSLYSKNPISYARTCTTVKDNGIDDGHCKSKEGVALSYSNTLSYNGVGDGLSVLKKERLKASLNESVNVINQEVDEVLHSVLGMYKIKKILRDREHIANNPISADADVSQSPVKKKKLLHSPSSKGVAKRAEVASSSEGVDTKECNVVSSEESQPRDLGRICLECKTTITPQWREGPDGTLCNACGIRNKKKGMSPLKVENKMKQEASSSEGIDAKECNVVSSEESQPRGLGRICLECKTTRTPQWREGPDGTLCNACGIRNKKKGMSPLKVDKRMKQELDDDLQFLLDVEGLHAKEVVKEVLKKYSDELAEKLGHMEQQLEKYLDVIMSKCRKMTKEEKLELRKLIWNLPPKNLDRVVDIIAQHRKLPEGHPCNEICIDLENEDNVTLWRLYYYAEAVANAKKFQE